MPIYKREFINDNRPHDYFSNLLQVCLSNIKTQEYELNFRKNCLIIDKHGKNQTTMPIANFIYMNLN